MSASAVPRTSGKKIFSNDMTRSAKRPYRQGQSGQITSLLIPNLNYPGQAVALPTHTGGLYQFLDFNL
eukprot:5868094-Prymnesium_polylepis.1